MNILIFGGIGSHHILCKVMFGMPGLFRNSYVDFTLKVWLVLRIHMIWLCALLVVAASMIGWIFFRSLIKKVECGTGTKAGSSGMV
jgi:hypothetical protein